MYKNIHTHIQAQKPAQHHGTHEVVFKCALQINLDLTSSAMNFCLAFLLTQHQFSLYYLGEFASLPVVCVWVRKGFNHVTEAI